MLRAIVSVIVVVGLTNGCAAGAPAESLLDRLAANDRYSTFVKAARSVKLDVALGRHEPYTVFAPTDAAFAALPGPQRDKLFDPKRRNRLRELVAYHMVPREVPMEALAGRERTVVSLEGGDLRLDGTDGALRVNGATVVAPDRRAENGIAHGIDTVLTPPTHSNDALRERAREVLGIGPGRADPSGS
ncbi:Uncaracterized surface protein containing fasciclin (FAS1) repeats [Limimonas halophila]|uniref:Uncaracterized surface protein containing fasciclin (FAS1) repeats n=1 Tax=Limimonas halophila TaxID=1082479 RepID=A0A1G7LPB4_9PROT|nr:fasciclin domain-containing protein [Limimonas halophila]SDF50840.1 Uncaracterized surface protein containing fasciclin (FAS1) repeats [Limimonas halophila]